MAEDGVEPAAFGQLKQGCGLRQILLRRKQKVGAKWKLRCLADDLRKIHRASPGGRRRKGRSSWESPAPTPSGVYLPGRIEPEYGLLGSRSSSGVPNQTQRRSKAKNPPSAPLLLNRVEGDGFESTPHRPIGFESRRWRSGRCGPSDEVSIKNPRRALTHFLQGQFPNPTHSPYIARYAKRLKNADYSEPPICA